MIDKFKFIQSYLKDLIVLVILIFLALIFYDKPLVKIKDLPKAIPNNLKEDKKEELQNRKDDSVAFQKQLSIFKGESVTEEKETKEPKVPSFGEALFSEEYENSIKLIAITGPEKNKKALVLDHMNNLRSFKKGDKIDNDVVVIDISDLSIKFKSKNRLKELFLYKRDENRKATKRETQLPIPVIRQQSKEEEIIEDQEFAEVEMIKKPRRHVIR